MAELEKAAQHICRVSPEWEKPVGALSQLIQSTKFAEGNEAIIDSLGEVLEVLSDGSRTLFNDMFKETGFKLTDLSVSDIELMTGTKFSFDSAAALVDQFIIPFAEGNTARINPVVAAMVTNQMRNAYLLKRFVTLPAPREGEYQPKSQTDPREFIYEVHDLSCDILARPPKESSASQETSDLQLRLCRRHYWRREPESLERRHRIIEALMQLHKDIQEYQDFPVQSMPTWEPLTNTAEQLRSMAGDDPKGTGAWVFQRASPSDSTTAAAGHAYEIFSRLACLIEDGDGTCNGADGGDVEVDWLKQMCRML